MYDGMVRILFSALTNLRPISLRLNIPPIITFINYLSLSVRIEKLKGVRLRAKSAKTFLNSSVPALIKVLTTTSSTNRTGS
jgi:hypothetical protein